MVKATRRIPFEELAADLAGVFERITRERESVLVEREGQAIAMVRPVVPGRPRRQRRAATGETALASGSRFTLESAAGSVPPLATARDWDEVERRVKEEHVERVVRDMADQ
jgi:hypothetical protein